MGGLMQNKLIRLKIKQLKRYYKFRYFFDRFIEGAYKPHKIASSLVVMVVVFLGLASILNPSVTAKTITFDKDVITSGYRSFNQIQLGENSKAISLQRGNIGTWSGENGLQISPMTNYTDVTLIYGPNNTLYQFAGRSGCNFEKFDFETQIWGDQLTAPPVGCGQGASLIYDNASSMYYLPAGNSTMFFKYDIGSDTWSRLADLPSSASFGTAATYVGSGGGAVYVMRGNGSTALLQYSVQNNTWTSKANFPTSSSVDQGTSLVWDKNTSIYAISNYRGEFKRYSISTDTWSTLQTAPNPTWEVYQLLWINGAIYAPSLQRSAEQLHMFKYDLALNSWAALPTAPGGQVYDFPLHAATDGTDNIYTLGGAFDRPQLLRYQLSTNKWVNNSRTIADNSYSTWEPMYDGGQTIYYVGGHNQGNMDKIWKKDLSTGEITRIGSQFGTNNGMAGAYMNNALYTVQYHGSTFAKYDLASNDWIALPNAPHASSWGSDVIEGGNGYLYVTFGYRPEFYRFSEANGWQRMANLPQSIGEGGQLARIGNSIYALIGRSQNDMYRYNIDTNTWTILPDTPVGGISWGGCLASDNTRYVYACVNSRYTHQGRMFVRFDTTSSTWERVADLPQATMLFSSAFFQSNANKIWVAQGGMHFDLWSYTASNAAYVTSGNWISKPFDLTQVSAWTSLNFTTTGSGTVTAFTRTSSNGRVWTEWQQVTGDTINSPANRYAQIKITLSGNGTSTPTVDDIGIQYTQETRTPDLPSQFSALSQKNGTQLNSGQTYEHQHPYFTWSGASDGNNGSGVDGYYVYFGTNSNADPVNDGNYQKNANYTVTTPMTAGSIYYLRIKVKDKLGNISDAATYFSYRYFYISPPGSVMNSTQADFGSGTNSGISITSDGTMSLISETSGSWGTGTTKMLPFSSDGTSMAVVDDFMYMLRGSGTNEFWRYNLTSNVWERQANLPENSTTGGGLVWDKDNYLYALAGGSSNGFYRYNILNNSWENLPNAPAFALNGSVLAYLGMGRIGVILAGAAEFYIYDTTNRTFSSKTSPPLSISGNAGSGMWHDNGDLVYVNFGPWDGWAYNRKPLAVYSLSQNTWRTLSPPPISVYGSGNNLTGDNRGKLYVFGNDLFHHGTTKNMAFAYDIESNTWEVIKGSTANLHDGSIASDGERYIYITPSVGNGRKLVRYDTLDNHFSPTEPLVPSYERLAWDHQHATSWAAGQASTMVFDGKDTLYAIGANQGEWARFIKRSVTTGKTEYLTQPPSVAIGGALEYSNNTLYYIGANNDRKFYKFNQSNETWELLASVPGNVYRPGSRALIALPNGKLLAVAGNGNRLYEYAPNGGMGTWTTLANAPGTILNGAVSYDGNDALYVLAGNNAQTFYKYTISSNSWTTLALSPVGANFGATMVHNGGKIYALVGNNSTSMFVYDTVSNSWQNGSDAPEYLRWGADMAKINEDYAIMMPGQDNGELWRFNFPASDKAYSGYATHISQPINIEGIFDYAGIRASMDVPADTKVEFWTRSSSDGVTWDKWVRADQDKRYDSSSTFRVMSKPQQLTQLKTILFSYNNLNTPKIHDYTLDYYFDTTPPSNPTVLSTYSNNTKATSLVDNTWYTHSEPTFDWPSPGEAGGATDGPLGSNLKGYYVYVGRDDTAVPQTAGTFVSDTEYTPTLTTSGTYYVRIQAVDMTGNVDPAVFAPFRYKFDNDKPTAPALVSVTPAGFTGRNNYTFQWPNSFDEHSGVAQYCYHTGALSGPFAVETCQDGTDLIDVSAAYQSGANVFYLRTRDIAGNYSESYTQASFYYSTDPPAPVTSLRAVPPTSEQNLFAFTWDYPSIYSGDPDQLSYCYSINTLPSPTNTTCTGDMFISAFKAATQRGTNTIYMVAKDESGNANWNNYASSNFIANTVSPGIPLNLSVTDTSESATNRWSMTLTWDPPIFQGNGITQYIIERSPDNHTYTVIGRGSNTAYVDLDIEPNTPYYYRVKAADSVDNQGGASATVMLSARGSFAQPPKVVSQPQVRPSFDQATISWVTDRASSTFIYYGTSPTQLTQSRGSLDPVTEHSTTISGLLPSATYYYRIQSFDNNRSYELDTALSQLYTFKTTETARIFGVQSTDVTLDSAVIGWQTSVPAGARIEYGPTTRYGFSQDGGAGRSTNHIFRLAGLQSGTRIHYRIIATTEYGSRITSDDYTLTTIARPVISNVRFQPVDDGAGLAVKLSWSTNVPTSSEVSYSALGDRQEVAESEFKTAHETVLRNLAGNAEYVFEIGGRDTYGNHVLLANQKWRSGTDTREPTISDVTINTTSNSAGDTRKAQMIISWKTNEPTTTQVKYLLSSDSTKTENLSPLDTEPTVNHVVVLSNLKLAEVYNIQPISKDISGNTAYGTSITAVTPDVSESPLDLILNILQRIFRL